MGTSLPYQFVFVIVVVVVVVFVSNSLLSLPLVVLLSNIPFAAILFLFPLCFFFSNSLDILSSVEN